MLKFFRKIRAKLIVEGNLRRYLIYAIGEILLVMIGILLALQVNTWNENRKIASKEQVYLKLLLNDLKRESLIIKKKGELHSNQVKNFKEGIDLLYRTQNNHSDVLQLFSMFSPVTDHLVPIDGTYQEIINSGGFDIFSNDILADKIIKYYNLNYDFALQIREFNDVTTREASNTRVTYNFNEFKYSLDFYRYPEMFDDKEWSYLNDPKSAKFKAQESIITLFIFREMDHTKKMNELIEENEELQRSIINELK